MERYKKKIFLIVLAIYVIFSTSQVANAPIKEWNTITVSEEQTEQYRQIYGSIRIIENIPKYKEVKAIITYYTASDDECGNHKGITASGKKVKRGIIAAPKSIPFGTKIKIKGQLYDVQDRGGAIKIKNGVYHFDVYVPTRKEAFKRGVLRTKVKIYYNRKDNT